MTLNNDVLNNDTLNNDTLNNDVLLAKKHGTPLFVLDVSQVQRQFDALNLALKNVAFYYAIKACDHPPLLQWMHQHLPIGFDIASSGEIKQLRLAQVYSQRTIHTHPIKTVIEIRDAIRYGCTTFVVDNQDELNKLIPYRKRIGILLRLNFASSQAEVSLAHKFGLPADDALAFIWQAKKLGLHIKGLSFHVGSQTKTPAAHVRAIDVCRHLFEKASAMGAPMHVLDIGGGFPVTYQQAVPNIFDFCQPIATALAKLPPSIDIIAEPGRILVAPAGRVICQIIGRAKREGTPWYYLDDGVYGCFSGQIYDGMHYPYSLPQYPKPLSQYTLQQCTLAGPSCDGIDVIAKNVALPNLQVGDLITHHVMGAYTLVSSSSFNRLKPAQVIIAGGQRIKNSGDTAINTSANG